MFYAGPEAVNIDSFAPTMINWRESIDTQPGKTSESSQLPVADVVLYTYLRLERPANYCAKMADKGLLAACICSFLILQHHELMREHCLAIEILARG